MPSIRAIFISAMEDLTLNINSLLEVADFSPWKGVEAAKPGLGSCAAKCETTLLRGGSVAWTRPVARVTGGTAIGGLRQR